MKKYRVFKKIQIDEINNLLEQETVLEIKVVDDLVIVVYQKKI